MCFLKYVLFAALLVSCHSNKKVSETTLVDNFMNHKSEFNELLTFMQQKIKLCRIDKYQTVPEVSAAIGLNDNELVRIRNLMRITNISVIDKFDKEIRFSSIYHYQKEQFGYSFSESKPKYLADKLNNIKCQHQSIDYKPIEKNWYMFVACEPD